MTIRTAALTGAATLALCFTAAPVLASAAITTKPVHLLAGPSTTFAPLLDLAIKSKVGVLWCGLATFDWCLIQFHKKQGWVRVSDLLALDANGLPLDGPNKNGDPLGGPKGSPQIPGPGGPQNVPDPASPAPVQGPITPTPIIVKNLGL